MSHIATQRPPIGVRTRRAVTIVVAAAATGLGWAAGRLAHVDYVVQTPMGARQITVVLVIAATAISGLAGWPVFSLVERHATDVMRAWIALGLLVLALSIVPIFVLRASIDARLALTALHCIAAAVLITGLPQRR